MVEVHVEGKETLHCLVVNVHMTKAYSIRIAILYPDHITHDTAGSGNEQMKSQFLIGEETYQRSLIFKIGVAT